MRILSQILAPRTASMVLSALFRAQSIAAMALSAAFKAASTASMALGTADRAPNSLHGSQCSLQGSKYSLHQGDPGAGERVVLQRRAAPRAFILHTATSRAMRGPARACRSHQGLSAPLSAFMAFRGAQGLQGQGLARAHFRSPSSPQQLRGAARLFLIK